MDTSFPQFEAEPAEESAALMRCFEKGWLHADRILDNHDREFTGYFFASPLHQFYVEKKLSSDSSLNVSESKVLSVSKVLSMSKVLSGCRPVPFDSESRGLKWLTGTHSICS
jgi:hypothetical protein